MGPSQLQEATQRTKLCGKKITFLKTKINSDTSMTSLVHIRAKINFKLYSSSF